MEKPQEWRSRAQTVLRPVLPRFYRGHVSWELVKVLILAQQLWGWALSSAF